MIRYEYESTRVDVIIYVLFMLYGHQRTNEPEYVENDEYNA